MDKSEKTQTNSEKMSAISILEKLEMVLQEMDKGLNNSCNITSDKVCCELHSEDHIIYHCENGYNIIVDIINELKKK